MTFGLVNAPTTSQRKLDVLLTELKCVEVALIHVKEDRPFVLLLESLLFYRDSTAHFKY